MKNTHELYSPMVRELNKGTPPGIPAAGTSAQNSP